MPAKYGFTRLERSIVENTIGEFHTTIAALRGPGRVGLLEEARNELTRKLWRIGWDVHRIANLLNKSTATIYRRLNDMGLVSRYATSSSRTARSSAPRSSQAG